MAPFKNGLAYSIILHSLGHLLMFKLGQTLVAPLADLLPFHCFQTSILTPYLVILDEHTLVLGLGYTCSGPSQTSTSGIMRNLQLVRGMLGLMVKLLLPAARPLPTLKYGFWPAYLAGHRCRALWIGGLIRSRAGYLDDRPGYNYLGYLLSCLSTSYKFSK